MYLALYLVIIAAIKGKDLTVIERKRELGKEKGGERERVRGEGTERGQHGVSKGNRKGRKGRRLKVP